MTENTLSRKQEKAIEALLSGQSTEAAAKSAKVKIGDLYDWLSDPQFRAALNAGEGELIDHATRRLLSLQGLALSEIAEVLADDQAKPADKLKASGLMLDTLLRLRELRNVEGRLLALEMADLKG